MRYRFDMSSETVRPPAAPLLVLEKLAAILDAFSADDPPLPLAELRRRTGLPTSTTQRLVANLSALGLIDAEGGGYRIGARIRKWAAASPSIDGDIVRHAQPLLDQLRDRHLESAALFRREGLLRVCVALADTRQTLRIAMWPGRLISLPAGAAGRVLTAWDTEVTSEILAIAPDRTPALEETLCQTRSQGWSISFGERETGATGIAVPVPDRAGAVTLAVSMQGPSVRVTEQRCLEWLPDLQAVASKLSSAP